MVVGEPRRARAKRAKHPMGSKKARKRARLNAAVELLDLASTGCILRLQSLLVKSTDLDVDFAGSDGVTALHKVRHRSFQSSSSHSDS